MTLALPGPAFMFPLPTYPWTCCPHPHIDTMEEWARTCAVEYLGFLPDNAAAMYGDQQLGRSAAVILPYGSLERIRPAALSFLYTTVLDDYYEFAEPQDTLAAADRVHQLILGAPVQEDDNGIFQLVARAGRELREISPTDFVIRYAECLRAFLANGTAREGVHRRAKVIPQVEEVLSSREYSIGVVFTVPLLELLLPSPLSPVTAAHPVLQRMWRLIARMVVVQNDVATVHRERERIDQGEVMNILLAAEYHWNLSLEQCYRYALHLNQQAIDEFAFLKDNLPDFGPEAERVREYVALLANLPGAWDAWYRHMTLRYSGAHPEADWLQAEKT
ncbi:terpene synthase family protein [Streptomyces sp. NPDC060028]|uniref:terpene synthase family protein n=1 Tax=Streptomyces sp. NPDC060028 TaxID=3347041 RepID=UPI0036A054BC